MSEERVHLNDGNLQRELLPRVVALRDYVRKKIPKRLHGVTNVDDVLQEVWMASYRNLATFAPDGPNAIDRWLTTIAVSKIVDAIRAARRLKRGGEWSRIDDAQRRMTSLTALFEQVQSPVRTPSHDVRKTERAHAVSIALNRLDTRRHRAVYLHHIEGLPLAEIAARMDTTESAVNSLIYNGLRDLRRFLGEAAEYFSDVQSTDSSAG